MTLADGLLADRYRLTELIAVGGMGEVWRAEDVLLGRPVAVKTLKPEYVGDEDFRARFRAEARHAAGLSHHGIASVFDFGESADRAWLVMELVDGEPLSQTLRRNGTLDVDRTLDVVAQTAAALKVAHDGGVVHRDVKPGNLLVRPDGAIKVTDFGIASAANAVPITRTGQVVGTAFYLAPEQANGQGAVPASDLYALGVVAFECLTGARPFPGDNPVSVALAHLHTPPPALPASVPAPVAELVGRLLSKDPADRPADAGAVAAQAQALRAGARTGVPAGSAPGDAATRVLAVVPPVAAPPADPATSLLATLPPRGPSTSPTPSGPAQPHRRPVRLAAILLAVLALILGLRAAFAEEQVLVPALAAGMPEAEALTALSAADLETRTVTEPSEQVPAGQLVALQPSPGTEVDAGSAVTVVVSSGPPPVRVSAEVVVGMDAQVVRDAFADRGLEPQLAYDGTGGPVGTVSAVEPVGDLPVGTTVVLHVVPEPPAARGGEDDDEGNDDERGGKKKRDDD